MTSTRPQRINLITIPGTDFVALADDANLTPKAIEAGTIALEREVADLPEVQALGPDDVVLDVGAFIGDTALIFAERGAVVYAYEPQTDAAFAARWNLRNERNVHFFEAAIGDGSPIVINSDPIACNSGTRTVSAVPGGTLRSKRLDDIAPPWPTFIKIDVEGFEPAVIAGAIDILSTYRPMLLIEIYPELLARNGWTPDAVIKPLVALGYEIREAIGNSTEPRWDILCRHATDQTRGDHVRSENRDALQSG